MESKKVIASDKFIFNVTEVDNNSRLDSFISKNFKEYSRTFFKNLISSNQVQVNGQIANKASSSVKEKDEVLVQIPIQTEETKKIDIEHLKIDIIYECNDFLIINKPAGVLMHPNETNSPNVTLVDWLITNFPEIKNVGLSERPGIVHRLDMLTSGLIIIPRNNYSHTIFNNIFKNRLIKKKYLAIVKGHPEQFGIINYPIIRHTSGIKMMAITPNQKNHAEKEGRESLTNYKVLKYFKDYSLIEVHPVTGRTHQIRVHFSAIKHPLLGDVVYGKKSKLIERQALHAYSLEFEYNGKNYTFTQEPPEDFKNLIELLSLDSHQTQ